MQTYLAELSTGRVVTCLAVNQWQAIALVHARHGARIIINFIERI